MSRTLRSLRAAARARYEPKCLRRGAAGTDWFFAWVDAAEMSPHPALLRMARAGRAALGNGHRPRNKDPRMLDFHFKTWGMRKYEIIILECSFSAVSTPILQLNTRIRFL